ncbi:hypothetical protein M9H77_22471 [Catharanthus roseus]|uniref:Uncharacterized protein n=1 Tax=Catharanthus roseus TaxID=4058 RepID=A0ACC0AQ95_CATRO|nr:hypothetical protein M9H77_22471 [Catharanthus roseus]
MGEMAVILQKFGDEESTLLDQYERLSFEVQLNQAILGRSLSEPSTLASRRRAALSLPPPQQSQVCSGGGGGGRRRKSGFQKVLKKLLKPIMGVGRGIQRKEISSNREHQKDNKLWKTFSRSLRV